MVALYNEIDPFAADWLSNLIAAGHVAAGTVDRRSIADVRATDLVGATQAHFFAGIGAWSYALRLAGWPDDRPVWTGSCPCQPFSAAGQGRMAEDARHLWPAFAALIADCRPPVVFGEQVASADGRAWLGAVRTDLEILGYAVGSADLCAAGVGAPHIRQRLYWVASDTSNKRESRYQPACGVGEVRPWGTFGAVDLREITERPFDPGSRFDRPSALTVADRVASRVGRLRGYGNAIVPQVAATFIRAFMGVTS